jgi:hypothetical protein
MLDIDIDFHKTTTANGTNLSNEKRNSSYNSNNSNDKGVWKLRRKYNSELTL